MAYFVYERSFDRSWSPVVYFEKPSKSVNCSDPERSQFWNVPDELLGCDGVSPQFGKLQTLFPAPKES